MGTIPEALSKRFELLQQLDVCYDLLEALRASGTGAEAEESFLLEKVAGIERELNESEPEAERIINQLQSDPVAWTVARLRYLQGYEWEAAAARVDASIGTAKSRVYRAFKSKPEPGANRE